MNILHNKLLVIFLLPFLLGIITIFGFSPYNYTTVNFFSFPLLLFLILKVKDNFNMKKKYFFYLGSSFGFGFFLFGNYWITISLTHDETFKSLIPFALILIPLFLSIFFGLAIFFSGSFINKNIYFLLIFSLIFSLFEFIRGSILSGFPWNLMAYTWSWSLETIQILSVIGTYSLSLISVTFFCIPFIFFQKKNLIKNCFFLFIFLMLFTLNFFHGKNIISDKKYDFNEDIIVKLVSPQFTLNEYYETPEILLVKKLIEISKPQSQRKTIFIWPEGVFHESALSTISKYKDLFYKNFSKNHLIILGINSSKIYKNKNNLNKYFNSFVVLNNELEILSIYNKIHLVPFGEYLPFENILSKLGLKKITHGYNSFSSGNNRKIILLSSIFENMSIFPLICYEIIFSGNIKKFNELPDLIINISEDAWFGSSIGPHQHFAKAIYRSVEEGVFIARVANKGKSAFINPNGKILKILNASEAGNIELNFPYFNEKTFFSKYGNKTFYFFIFLYIFLILIFKKQNI